MKLADLIAKLKPTADRLGLEIAEDAGALSRTLLERGAIDKEQKSILDKLPTAGTPKVALPVPPGPDSYRFNPAGTPSPRPSARICRRTTPKPQEPPLHVGESCLMSNTSSSHVGSRRQDLWRPLTAEDAQLAERTERAREKIGEHERAVQAIALLALLRARRVRPDGTTVPPASEFTS